MKALLIGLVALGGFATFWLFEPLTLGPTPVAVANAAEQVAVQEESQQDKQNKNKDRKMVKVRVFNSQGELVGPVEMPKVIKTLSEWRKILTPDQFKITRQSGTEAAFCGTLLDNKKEGVYTCVCCGLPLFSSDAKFNSGTGWPSFFQPIAPENVTEKVDRSYGMVRMEINCARCDSHLGHVFNDGPPPTGNRHCLNSESLEFTEATDLAKLADPAVAETAADKGGQR